METNPNTPEGETTPQEDPTAEFSGFNSDYSMEDHILANRAGIEPDFELSVKPPIPPENKNSFVDGSDFRGKEHKPFENVVPPPKTTNESTSLPKGVDCRQKNDSSLL